MFGIDLSPQMVALARRAHPGLRFDVGSMLDLDLPEGALGGVVANYSIIHIPRDRLPEVFAEFHRVLAPGGYVLLAFQVGELLSQAGLVERARLLREPDDDGVETTQQAYLLARKPTDVSRP